MNNDKNKILNDTINYLKFYNEHYNYSISQIEMKEHSKDNSLFQQDEVKEKYKSVSDVEIFKLKLKDEEVTVVKDAGRNSFQSTKEDWMECKTLEAFSHEIKNCPKCKILFETRKQVVFGTGNPDANVVVVGEAPGADEDEQGKPFVGRAGKLLTDILKAINFNRDEVYICNILKCRPPGNRNPLPDEIVNCEPYLFKQLEMIKPKMILAVGTFAAQTLLKSKETLSKMRGKFHIYNGIKMMVTFHPAALLRNPGWKKPTWEDVQLFRAEYDRMLNSK